jgi:hypothetical protein
MSHSVRTQSHAPEPRLPRLSCASAPTDEPVSDCNAPPSWNSTIAGMAASDSTHSRAPMAFMNLKYSSIPRPYLTRFNKQQRHGGPACSRLCKYYWHAQDTNTQWVFPQRMMQKAATLNLTAGYVYKASATSVLRRPMRARARTAQAHAQARTL